MYYDKDIDKYKCGPAVTTLTDVASPNAYQFRALINPFLYTYIGGVYRGSPTCIYKSYVVKGTN